MARSKTRIRKTINMKIMKLITMTDFVLSQTTPDYLELCEFEENSYKIHNYAKFLKQPLELWMFVPCDEDGNILEEPKNQKFYNKKFNGDWCDLFVKNYEYQQAKERCLFVGCVYDEEMEVVRSESGIDLFYIPKAQLFTIEGLVKYNLKLTQTAIKQIVL